MTAAIDWRIPPSVLSLLEQIPRDRPVAMLLRHSVRPPLPEGRDAYTVPITATGVGLARQLGHMLGAALRSLHASPLTRCIQTAEALRDGAGLLLPVRSDRLLGDPGVYVVDARIAGSKWHRLGHEAVMANLVAGDVPLPGLALAEPAARFLVQHMLAASAGEPGVHVFVTHDSLITATAARILRQPLGPPMWPWYLEAAFFWRDGNALHAVYRDRHGMCDRTPLVGFDDEDVVELARREIAATVGLDCPARFFLAGGAFKTLLTGHPPRDLDLWAHSESDRKVLVSSLKERKATPAEPRPFSDAFEIADRIVEVAHRTHATLDDVLARFDIALSAAGVEHVPGGRWHTVVHPLARRSINRREILLLRPLANWKYALATLERMRRYADELGYAIPPEEVDEIWRVFDPQSPEMQRGMLERFDRTARGGYGVRKEAERCLHR